MNLETLQYPPGRPRTFRATLHGTVFAGRSELVEGLKDGDRMLLVPDPPGGDAPGVWVHVETGDPVGHLPPEIAGWLWPWLSSGGGARATAIRVHGEDVPSWRRVVVEVDCAEVG